MDKKITSEVCIHHLSFNENDYKKIHKHFAENFLGKEKKPFTTIPSAYKAIDDLRNQHERDQKKMSQLEEINEYVQELQNQNFYKDFLKKK